MTDKLNFLVKKDLWLAVVEKYGGNAEVHTMISFEMDLGVGGYK